jgi:hypothetical protein
MALADGITVAEAAPPFPEPFGKGEAGPLPAGPTSAGWEAEAADCLLLAIDPPVAAELPAFPPCC